MSDNLETKDDGEFVSDEDKKALTDARAKVTATGSVAERAVLAAQLAESERQNLIYRIYFKYSLSTQDTIDEATGKVVRGGMNSQSTSTDASA